MNDDFLHPADNFAMTQWTRLSDPSIFKKVPFGVYAFTGPMNNVPSKNVFPFMIEDTLYFGKSGNSYDDYFYDRKSFDPETGKENFHMNSMVHMRIKSHKNNMRCRNKKFDKLEGSYQKFVDIYGFADDDLLEKMNVCVIVPKYPIPDFQVTSWSLLIESYCILLYQQKFGKTTLMNVGHDPYKKVEGSYANNKKLEAKMNSLESYF